MSMSDAELDEFANLQQLRIQCDHCRHEFTESFGRIQADPKLVCPVCGGSIPTDPAHLQATKEALKHALRETAGKFPITIKL